MRFPATTKDVKRLPDMATQKQFVADSRATSPLRSGVSNRYVYVKNNGISWEEETSSTLRSRKSVTKKPIELSYQYNHCAPAVPPPVGVFCVKHL